MLVIRDTRESGEMLEAALAAGITSAGGDVLLGGVLPTPAAPLLLGRYGFDLAAVISASHNPFADNGIKFFGSDGFKLSDADEAAIETLLAERPTPRASAPRHRPSAASASCTARWRTTCASCRHASAAWTSRASTSSWTARTARPTRPRPRSSAASARP